MKEFINKYLTRKNRNIIAIVIIVLGVIFLINYSFFEPTYINQYIATKIYDTPANSAFADQDFYNCVIDAYNEENNTSLAYTTSLSDNQLQSLNKLVCSWTENYDIHDTTGLEKMVGLTYIDLRGCIEELYEIDLSKNTNLVYLYLTSGKSFILNSGVTHGPFSTQITKLDISNNPKLKELYIENSKLTNLDTSNNLELEILEVGYNKLQELNVSKNTKLTYLGVGENNLSAINVTNNIKLQYLNLYGNSLTQIVGLDELTSLLKIDISYGSLEHLDLGKNAKLTYLGVSDNQLTSLDVSNNTSLTTLKVYKNQLTSLDVSNNTALTYLDVSDNQLTSLYVSNNTSLTDLRAYSNQLTSLDVSKNTLLTKLYADNNQLTSLDVSNNTTLTTLWVDNNQLTSLDVSNNTALISSGTSINSNPYSEILYVYKGSKAIVGNNVKIATQLGWDSPIWTSSNINMAMVDDNGIVTTLESGSVQVKGTVSGEYTTTSTINVVEITSDKYEINEENNYIIINDSMDSNIIKNNISVSNENVIIDVDLDNYKLYVKYEDEVLKEFKLIGYTSSQYDLSSNYIYIGTNELDLSKIDTINCNKEVSDNKLLIKINGVLIREYDLISISSEVYDLSKEYIYVGNNELNTEDINITNGIVSIKDNKLLIKYDDKIIDEYKIVSISSDVYDLSKEYIYVGAKNINIDNIKVINGTIFTEDNKVVIKYNDEILDEYNILKIRFNNYNCFDKNIIVLEEVSYNDFITNIEVSNGITYKLFNGEEEVTSGNVLVDYILKIYYNDIVIDEYTITDENEYLEFDESLDIDEDNTIINNIKVGTNINSVIGKINTSGNISVLDKNDNVIADSTSNLGTGYKFKIELYSQTLYYAISVRGDINGDRQVNINDVIGVSKHVIKGNVISGIEYVNASDVNDNGNIDINDVIKLAKHIIKNTEL